MTLRVVPAPGDSQAGLIWPLSSGPTIGPMGSTRQLRIPVFGLGCGGSGASAIERELAATDGVLAVYVNRATETAYVDWDPARTDSASLARAIETAGYRAGRPAEV